MHVTPIITPPPIHTCTFTPPSPPSPHTHMHVHPPPSTHARSPPSLPPHSPPPPTPQTDRSFHNQVLDSRTAAGIDEIVPPKKPEIYNETNHLVTGDNDASIIGPYNEGSALKLTCVVNGGRPTPVVQWLVNDEVRSSQESRSPPGVINTTLVVPRLSRNDLHAVFECRATNFNDSAPISSTVTLDMNFQPMNVSILSSSSSLSAETEYELVCQAWGSRPAAVISWWKGGTLALKEAVMTTSPDSNVTTSILKYRAEMSDSGKYLTCRAENKQIPQSAREDGIKLNIHYKPVVTLQMGSTLDPENIKEGDDVYFECHINANPEVQRVLWYHNGKPLEHRTNRGIIIQNQTLVLQEINRESAGFYTCRAVNMEGEGESQPVELQTSRYCRQHRKTVYGTALHEPASVTCEVEASPGPVTFRWTFNNTSEHLPIPASAVSSHNFTSVASYAPKSHPGLRGRSCAGPSTTSGPRASPAPSPSSPQ
ncbi:putative sidestep protein [Penaeus vannamei]|uniref:Putative sidestep protein n=1 Tax=Penaeus vannamei TaxID=6689 RepID=A0A423ST03_PENVA|nr:putative sidestep protein [Penaeus vannamei]